MSLTASEIGFLICLNHRLRHLNRHLNRHRPRAGPSSDLLMWILRLSRRWRKRPCRLSSPSMGTSSGPTSTKGPYLWLAAKPRPPFNTIAYPSKGSEPVASFGLHPLLSNPKAIQNPSAPPRRLMVLQSHP